jgi:SAM-dependent methyltransferase
MTTNEIWNWYYKAVGIAFLALGKAKHRTRGYERARAFSTSELLACIDYDIKVVDEWLEALEGYTRQSAKQIEGARVLELGPGADFGVPLYLLSKGVAQYSAIDAFPLALKAPAALHEAILDRIATIGSLVPRSVLMDALPSSRRGPGNDTSILRYVVREDFDIATAFEPASFDFVFSQAAFEHFDDVEEVIRQVSTVVRQGARLVAGVDLKTHARWLCDKDPLNIYRYAERTYRSLGFRTMPNRVATSEYARMLIKHGWKDVEIRNVATVADEYFERVRDSLDPAFRKGETRNLWIVVCATRV